MICALALIISGILGVFSATHRKVAGQAFDCVFRRLTLRPCDSGLDTQLKAHITGRLLRKSPKVGRFFFRNFELFSWLLLILTVLSIAGLAVSGYNFVLYGNCNGEEKGGFCIFDPTGTHQGYSKPTESCSVSPASQEELSLQSVNLPSFAILNPGKEHVVFFVGCYGCTYTKQAYPSIKKIREREDVTFVFAHMPLHKDMTFHNKLDYCVYNHYPGLFEAYMDMMFSLTPLEVKDTDNLRYEIPKLGISRNLLETCIDDEKTILFVERQTKELQKTQVYGTPTVFIDGQAIVGPKPYRVYWWKL